MKVVTFGELLLRLSAPGYNKLFQQNDLESTFCGGEANVAVSLANFGIDSSFVTKLPDNDVGVAGARSLRYFGVDISNIIYAPGRMGLYYLEKGASQRPSRIIYDRVGSAIALARQDDFEWKRILSGAEWFHWTGINPALGGELPQICEEACKEAKKQGLIISCDLNYRKNLWSSEEAEAVMTKLLSYVDICVANEEDAEKVLGIKASDTDVESGKLNKAGYESVARQICDGYDCKKVAITLRKSYSASRNGWSAMLYDASSDKAFYSENYDIQLVDRVGGGDSFSAGLIYGLITGMTDQDTIEFATAASCLKQTMEGDFNRSSIEDVKNLLKFGGNGRVLR